MPDPGSPFAPYQPSAQRGEPLVALVLAETVEKDVYELAELQVGVRGGTVHNWAERIAKLVGGERGTVVLARTEGTLTGFGSVTQLSRHPDDGAPAGYYLTGVSVPDEWRRRGIGATLTQWRMDWTWKRAPETWCFISAENMASLDLHHALGFTEIRRGPRVQGVTFDCGEGVLLRALRPEGG